MSYAQSMERNRLSPELVVALRALGYGLSTGLLDTTVMDDAALRSALTDRPEILEKAVIVWANTLRVDGEQDVLNEADARTRTAQYIRSVVDDSYRPAVPITGADMEWD
jgi:hypothetical protein